MPGSPRRHDAGIFKLLEICNPFFMFGQKEGIAGGELWYTLCKSSLRKMVAFEGWRLDFFMV
jgi:hypothetical protein